MLRNFRSHSLCERWTSDEEVAEDDGGPAVLLDGFDSDDDDSDSDDDGQEVGATAVLGADAAQPGVRD